MALVKSVCRAMEHIAPLRLAEKWDNVGLLLEAPFVRPNATRVLLTIDLTTEVASEALATPTAVVVAYHPTIFKPLAALTLANPLQRSLLRLAAAGVSVYVPHTALDGVAGGINDWLADGVRAGAAADVRYLGEAQGDEGGQGRLVALAEPVSMRELQARVKKHLDLKHLQVAYPAGQDANTPVKTVAICAGSGGSMFAGVKVDVYFTGEMSHHEVLAAVASGANVILCGHTNTERGYLPTLAQKLKSTLSNVVAPEETDAAHASFLRSLEIEVSKEDKDPVQIV
ncbi:Nif3-like dinuclear metal center hexameric protein [Phanerochaete sordida]|uniref:Nif3-like dinuclear metal center hexameric protein n=1 Tax=Phanerochaete sordida TaxID=48140 RepID=A0A9P3L8N8_9APHY|nr:Nif3-like dinuclear metal center hexameric protein [Phanerochaete sordida]